ncbi:MAG: hypothetical protein ACTS1X_14090 [Parasphingopyxis sp.]|uniref:hypothetical protein n=1 Tax=Parasphingopyxis sp. TaxID=1920299 RepID=UPI003F9EBD4E
MVRTARNAAIVALAAAAFAGPAAAQQDGQTAAAPPPCRGDAYRAFDFWIGEWNVHTPDGRLAGVNSIQPINAGCGLIERYSVNDQLFGQSYNFYDPTRETWTQLWLSPGLIIRLEGPVGAAGSLTMHGTSTYTQRSEARGFTGRWTLRDDGTVLQEFWERDPESGEWANWFTGIYSRSD